MSVFKHHGLHDGWVGLQGLRNVSRDAVEVSAKIRLSVAFHANTKDRNMITITAAAFAPLGLVVP